MLYATASLILPSKLIVTTCHNSEINEGSSLRRQKKNNNPFFFLHGAFFKENELIKNIHSINFTDIKH